MTEGLTSNRFCSWEAHLCSRIAVMRSAETIGHRPEPRLKVAKKYRVVRRKTPSVVVECNGPTMLARIGIMLALNRHVEPVFESSGQKTHWGKRKLKRDR